MEFQNRDTYLEQSTPYIQRGSMMYSTLPCRRAPKIYQEETETYRRYSPQPANYYQEYPSDNYGYNSLPRRQIYPTRNEEPTYNYVSPNHVGIPKMTNIQNQVPSNRDKQYNFQSSTPNKPQTNLSKIPMGISNFFSPIRKTQPTKTDNLEASLKISPIEPCNSGKFQSSTPYKPVNSAVNLSNALLSPKKSTMSNEELYAVIHRSKKKLNIKTDSTNNEVPTTATEPEKIEPKLPETGYLSRPQTRSSWSPNNDELSKNSDGLSANPGSRQSWACNDRLGTKKTTSRYDFKRLLLQQNSKTPSIQTGKKLSAVEQLKLTKDQIPPKKVQSPMQIADLSASPKNFGKKTINGPSDLPTSPEKRPPTKIMSPRSAWRFASPRSDVLSSTILEDCREDETSNSSNERSSPRLQNIQGSLTKTSNNIRSSINYGRNVQSSVAYSNTVSDGSKNIINSNKTEFKINKPELTRSQYIQARRNAYFNINPNVKTESEDSPPTLETAL